MILKDIESLSDAEKLALVQAVQESVAANKAKQTTQEVGQYAKLVVDAIKKIKADLEERYAAMSTDIEIKAAKIKDGKDGLQGPKGEQGDRGFDGVNGKDGRNGKDGKDGVDGRSGNGVADAYIDFDGSLVLKLDNGDEINAGEVVPMDVAEKIKVIGNGGGTSQYVLDALAALQTAIDGVSIPSQTGNAGKYLGTTGSALQWEDFPDLTITDTFVVNTQAAMLALSAQKGDVAVRSDLNKTYILTASPATTLGNWQELLTPTDLVLSVAGRTGNVTLSNSDISGLGTMATQAASSVAITGGTIDGATIGGTTPAVITGSTINANTKVVSPDFYAQSVLGGNLRTHTGTSLLNWDGGGSGNITVNGGLTATPANKSINLSPTGTGTVTINPATASSMDNVAIGATTAAAITGTTITATTYAGGNVANWNTAYGWGNHASAGYVSSGGALGTPSSGTLTNCTFPTLNQNTTGTAASTPKLLSTNFTIEESGGKLLFKYGATTIASIDSTGVFTTLSNHVANGTP